MAFARVVREGEKSAAWANATNSADLFGWFTRLAWCVNSEACDFATFVAMMLDCLTKFAYGDVCFLISTGIIQSPVLGLRLPSRSSVLLW